jgi:hypothetical protein
MDQQWLGWHQLAMRHFLLSAPQTTSISNSWLPAGMLPQVKPTSSTESTQDLYWPQDASLVAGSTTTFEGLNTLALEGDPWELSMVSKVRPLENDVYTQTLTNKYVEYRGKGKMTCLVRYTETR